MVDTAAYLSRIGYSGPTEPNAETLRGLHRAHLYSVPFENLDIGLHRKIECTERAALHKIVERKRGGFCYEMNGAFSALLRSLGFEVTLLSARVAREDGTLGPEFDHLTLRVDLDEPWLADVGFGDSFIDALRLNPDVEQAQGRRQFRLVEQDGLWHMQRADSNQPWKLEYAFRLIPRRLEEFAAMCEYHQTSPESSFTRKRICTLARPDGRITLTENRLILTAGGEKTEAKVDSAEEWATELKTNFNIVL